MPHGLWKNPVIPNEDKQMKPHFLVAFKKNILWQFFFLRHLEHYYVKITKSIQ